MRPRNPASVVVETKQVQGVAEEPGSDSYACVLCGARWGYREIYHTARCPECGGGLVRDVATETTS